MKSDEKYVTFSQESSFETLDASEARRICGGKIKDYTPTLLLGALCILSIVGARYGFKNAGIFKEKLNNAEKTWEEAMSIDNNKYSIQQSRSGSSAIYPNSWIGYKVGSNFYRDVEDLKGSIKNDAEFYRSIGMGCLTFACIFGFTAAVSSKSEPAVHK